jgi:hypothetical protein
MCGLVGTFGALNHSTDKVFKQLLIVDSLRGMDSTGIAAVPRDAEPIVVKAVGHPFDLMERDSFSKAVLKMNKVLMGHNRFATVGAVTRASAHPFEFETLIGMHNGTLHNKHQFENGYQYAVDSQALFGHIDRNGIRSAMEIAEGAWSLVWWDKVEEELCFLRNKERPMFIAKIANENAFAWASEDWMLEVCILRNGLKIESLEETPIDHMMSFSLPKAFGKLEKARMIKMEGRQVPKSQNQHGQTHGVSNFPVARAGNDPYSGATRAAIMSQQQASRGADPVVSKSGAREGESVTPTGRVIRLVRRPPQPTPAKVVGTDSVGYTGRKQIPLEVVGKGKDEHGATYVTLFDENMPTTSIRLYLHKGDNADKYVGKNILGDIDKWVMASNGQRHGYYKVGYTTHRMVVSTEEEEWADSKGNLLKHDDWMAKHGECCWCSGPVFPVDKFKFVNQGADTLCNLCCEDPQVAPYISN